MIKHKLIIDAVCRDIGAEGFAIVSLPDFTEVQSVIGTLRYLGLSVVVGENMVLTVTPKQTEHVKQPGSEKEASKADYARELLLEKDPTVFPTDSVQKDQAYLRYHSIFAKTIKGQLWISTTPLKSNSIPLPALLEEAIKAELPATYDFSSPEEAKGVVASLRKKFGILLLVRPKQLGRTVIIEYKSSLPDRLPTDYSLETRLGWVRALVTRIGVGSALIAYNKHERNHNRNELSKRKFESLLRRTTLN